jgi:hypothetical protein
LAFRHGFAGEVAKIRFLVSNISAADTTLGRVQFIARGLRVEVALPTMYGYVAEW